MDNALFALLGWAAGVFSVLILEWNRRHRTAKAVTGAVRGELRELTNRFANVVYNLGVRTQSLDAELLEWLLAAHRRYDGVNRNQLVVSVLEKLAAHPDQVAKDVATLYAQNPAAASGLKKYPTPALDAAVQVLPDLQPQVQTAILEIRTNIAMFDAVVDDSRDFFKMTFQNLDEGRMATVDRNLNSSYRQALRVARQIVDLSARFVWPTAV